MAEEVSIGDLVTSMLEKFGMTLVTTVLVLLLFWRIIKRLKL